MICNDPTVRAMWPAVRADPDDDTVRLALADRLDEVAELCFHPPERKSFHARAKLIRLQCQFARMDDLTGITIGGKYKWIDYKEWSALQSQISDLVNACRDWWTGKELKHKLEYVVPERMTHVNRMQPVHVSFERGGCVLTVPNWNNCVQSEPDDYGDFVWIPSEWMQQVTQHHHDITEIRSQNEHCDDMRNDFDGDVPMFAFYDWDLPEPFKSTNGHHPTVERAHQAMARAVALWMYREPK